MLRLKLCLKCSVWLTCFPKWPCGKSAKLKLMVFAEELVVFIVDSSTTPSNANATSNIATSRSVAGLYWMPHLKTKSTTSLPVSLHTIVTGMGSENVGGVMPGYSTDNNETTCYFSTVTRDCRQQKRLKISTAGNSGMPKYDSRLISSSTLTLAIGRQSDSDTQTGRPSYNGNNWSHLMLRMAMRCDPALCWKDTEWNMTTAKMNIIIIERIGIKRHISPMGGAVKCLCLP